jgi:hypothetical protein
MTLSVQSYLYPALKGLALGTFAIHFAILGPRSPIKPASFNAPVSQIILSKRLFCYCFLRLVRFVERHVAERAIF